MLDTAGTTRKTTGKRGRAARLALAGAAAASLAVAMAPAASASPLARVPALSWQVQQPPAPAGSIASNLVDVSCTAAGACTAVGFDESVSGGQGVFTTYAERWNGSTWTIQNTPNGVNSNLNGVDCLTATDCVAVGDVLTGAGFDTGTLAETWNGASWSTQSTPTPKGTTRGFLIDVSCASATSCEAVGSFSRKSGDQFLLAEKWNGTSWKIQTTPAPGGATSSGFNSVSCASARSCVAVGTASGNMLAEQWNGTSWTIMSTPAPAGSTGTTLSGVSCTSASACTATGEYSSGTGEPSLAERWDGSTWTQQSTPNRVGAKATFLADVSCASASQCMSAGTTTQSTRNTQAEHWNGTSWTLQDPGEPAGSATSILAGVSCPVTTDCMAVGTWIDGSGTEFNLAAQYS